MAIGPGIYDHECEVARKATGADTTVLIIVGGMKGSGFSIQSNPGFLNRLPGLLRQMANDIEKDMKGN